MKLYTKDIVFLAWFIENLRNHLICLYDERENQVQPQAKKKKQAKIICEIEDSNKQKWEYNVVKKFLWYEP